MRIADPFAQIETTAEVIEASGKIAAVAVDLSQQLVDCRKGTGILRRLHDLPGSKQVTSSTEVFSSFVVNLTDGP